MFSFDDLRVPVVQAPMAGGPSTPELAAAVSAAGGLGFLAAGYLSAAALGEQIEAVRSLGARVFGVNVFVPESVRTDRVELARYSEALRPWRARYGLETGDLPVWSEDDWTAKIEHLLAHPVPVVSFAFGLPEVETVRGLQAAGTAVLLSVSDPEEAVEAAALGPDALVVQSEQAGGHRATLSQDVVPNALCLEELLGRVRTATDLPLVAAGGVVEAADARRALEVGAVAVQAGTAFAVAQEAGTNPVHRAALLDAGGASSGAGESDSGTGPETVVTRVFSGRPARALVNDFVREAGPKEIAGYPEVHYLTSPIRAAAKAAADPVAVNLWAGTGVGRVRAGTAAEILGRLTP